MDFLSKSESQSTFIEDVNIDVSIGKIVGLATVGVILAFLFGYCLKLFILNQQTNLFLYSLLTAFLLLAVFLLDIFFVKQTYRSWLIIFLEMAAIVAAFFDVKAAYVGNNFFVFTVVFIASFLLLIWADYSGRQTIQDLLKIKFWHVGKASLPKAVFGIALLSSAIYYNISYSGDLAKREFPISFSAFERLVAPTSGVVRRFIPEFNPSSSFGDAISRLAKRQLESAPQFDLLPEEQKKILLSRTVAEFNKTAADFIGNNLVLNSDETLGRVLYDVAVNRFANLPENIKSAAPVGIAVAIFLIIIGFALPIRWIVTILAYIVYQILLALGFATVAMEGKSKEVVILR